MAGQPNRKLFSCAQIIAGLKKHIDRAELEGSLVVVITNLRTAKLAVPILPHVGPKESDTVVQVNLPVSCAALATDFSPLMQTWRRWRVEVRRGVGRGAGRGQ